ncbi:hypothetical protein GJAV_G00194530 [Gymnothorax javanicus]|nr:hypothetical protein GJAV_G00194530 [Gymnothorax javanicus]
MTKLNAIWKRNTISLPVKIKLYRLLISILLYGCECWTLNAETERWLQAFEHKCYRKLLRIHDSEHKTNKYVRQRIDTIAGNQEPLLTVVKRCKLAWFDHVELKRGWTLSSGELVSQVVTMSEEAEIEDCEEASEAAEGSVEPYTEEEEESSSQLREKVLELRAENSALALANESQREAYERCLDEVANHVVQALLNQKDLREECIKLKMRVFELERQNQTLSELLHHKLRSRLSPCPQVQGGPTAQDGTNTPPGSDSPVGSKCKMSRKSDGELTRNGAPGARGPTLSMDPMSPFLQKKAHIMEVLRKLEESDPLKFHPSAGLSSYHDFSQALFSADTNFTATTSCPSQLKMCWPLCLHSRSDTPEPDSKAEGPVEGTESSRQQNCHSCLLLAHKGLEELLTRATAHSAGVEVLDGLLCPETKVESALNSAGMSQSCVHKHGVSTHPIENGHDKCCSLLKAMGSNPLRSSIKGASQDDSTHVEPAAGLTFREEVQSGTILDKERCGDGTHKTPCKSLHGDAKYMTTPLKDEKCCEAVAFPGLAVGPEECFFSMAAEVAKVKNSLYAATSSLPVPGCARVAYSKRQAEGSVCNGLSLSSRENTPPQKVAVEPNPPSAVLERGGHSKQSPPPAGKYKLSLLSASTSGVSEPKPSPISSPSRLLKFLKIPSIGERAQVTNSLRLSPQLTRNSKIPCRTNNYEVYHSSANTCKGATTAERTQQLPPSSSPKTDSGPATLSARTFLPKPEDSATPPTNYVASSSHMAPKAGQIMVASPAGQSQPLQNTPKVPHYENVSDLITPCAKSHLLSAPECKDPLQERRMSPPGEEGPCGSATSTETLLCGSKPADRGDGEEGAAWYQHNSHHSLPVSSAVHHLQSTFSHSQSVDKGTEPLLATEDPPMGKLLGDPCPQPFQERLAALGKLKSAEDLQKSAEQPGSEESKEAGSENRALSNKEGSDKTETSEHNEEGDSTDSESPDSEPCPKADLGDNPVKLPAPCLNYEVVLGLSAGRAEKETTYPETSSVKMTESPKVKVGLQPSNPDPPLVLHNYAKFSSSQNPSHNAKTIYGPQNSPSKAQFQPCQSSSHPRVTRPLHDQCSTPLISTLSPHQMLPFRPEDRSKLSAGRKKGLSYAESPPPRPSPPRRPEVSTEKKAPSPGPQSAIEQKVMKGIEENILKLQPAETKRASSSIASWFGLRKSKLPALSRKSDVARPKEDRREWRLVSSASSSSFSSSSKSAARQKQEPESLNISKLMEKAEDLRRALEEEQAYVTGMPLDRPSRGHSCEVVMNQSQGQLSVMYRGGASDNFMQELLNRVDAKDGGEDMQPRHRRLSFDSKKLRPVFGQQRNGIIIPTRSREEMEKAQELAATDDVTSNSGPGNSMNPQPFAGCGASIHTLDSGIGTFPPPECFDSAAVKSVPKPRPRAESDSHRKPGPTTKVPRKSSTLDRQLTSLQEDSGSQESPKSKVPECRSSNLQPPTTIHEDEGNSKPSKPWTLPQLKMAAVPSEVYLGVNEEVGTAVPGNSFRGLFVTSCDRDLL